MAPTRSMTPARRLRIWEAHNGICEWCKQPVALDACDIDHRVAVWISRDDSDENLRPFHRETCHRPKTKIDAGIIAKIKRIIAREDGTRRERAPIKSAGFNKSLRKRMNGKVEVRT